MGDARMPDHRATLRLASRASLVLAASFALAASASNHAAAQTGGAQPRVGPPNGSLVAVGGAMQSPEIFRRFIELAGGTHARIVVVPTALGAGDYDDGYAGVQAFRAYGARNVTVLHTMDSAVANTDAFAEPLRTADGVFFGGGRQWILAEVYGGTKTEEELRGVLERGGVIGGNSAGATILGSFLVRGDTQSNDIVVGEHQRGFGYLRNVAIDQHVLRRNRHFDLIEVVEAHPELLGVGLDEDTAIIVRGDFVEVVGASYALIYDNGATTGRDGRFYFLAPGDGFDLGTRSATRPSRTAAPVPNVTPRPWSGR